jgi:putative ABC transport system permease protein
MYSGNFKLAIKTMRGSRWQSALTMFGIIVGIVSVITTVSLGEGIKRQVLGEINTVGSDLITIRPGNAVIRDKNGNIIKINPEYVYGFGSGSLSEQDTAVIKGVKGIKESSPLRLLNGSVKTENREYKEGFVLGTNPDLPSLLKQKVEYGIYFSKGEESRQVAVIGKRVAEELFQENVPVGQSLTIRGEDFIVRGVFEEFAPVTLGQGIDLNRAIFVPDLSLKNVAGEAAPVVRVLVRPDNPDNAKELATNISNAVEEAHGGQNDITVLRQDENLAVNSNVLNLLTGFVAAIAAISLLVGGIGIMNIMLVSVSERTREIGIRKAVGATNRQIRNQFMAEAITLSFIGGLFGIIISFAINFIIRVTSNLTPVITWPVVVIATGVAISVGVLFGTVPAIKAARKDPIESLRVGS